jgi:hypothetical protein
LETQLARNPVLNFYSDKVRKIAVSVIIKTNDHIITGDLYTRPMNRVIDELITSDKFLALTDAVVYEKSGAVRFRTEFMTINRDQVVFIIPKEDLLNKPNPDS